MRKDVRQNTATQIAMTEATLVIASLPPIELAARESMEIYKHKKRGMNITAAREEENEKCIIEWQKRWTESTKGRWTYSLILDIRRWVERNHGQVSFHLTQALTGYGCFPQFLHRFGKLESPACWFCGYEVNNAHHTLFEYDAWEVHRRILKAYTGEDVSSGNIVDKMLERKEVWDAVEAFVKYVMRKKEEEERRRQNQPVNLLCLLECRL